MATSGELEPWSDLRGKVVMVTGASSGLGKEFSLDLARAGCKIIAAARRVDRLKILCDEINQPGFTGAVSETVRAVAVELDVTANGPAIEAAVKKGWDAFGRIDCLINNAGIVGPVKNPLDLSEEEWNGILTTNLTGPWLVSKSVCTRMRDAKLGGSVINIGSISGLNRGFLPGGVAYCSSKAALNTMTKVMAMELGVHNIRVNCVNPGLFKSEITEGLMEKDWVSRVAKKSVPLRTFGESDPALTSVIRYLIHDSSRYVSGSCFIADTGTTLPGVPLFSSL